MEYLIEFNKKINKNVTFLRLKSVENNLKNLIIEI